MQRGCAARCRSCSVPAAHCSLLHVLSWFCEGVDSSSSSCSESVISGLCCSFSAELFIEGSSCAQEEKEAEREAARAAAQAAAAAAADACTLCGAQWGQDADRDELWVACGLCNRWYHGACAGATQEEIDSLGQAEWECPECQMHRCASMVPSGWHSFLAAVSCYFQLCFRAHQHAQGSPSWLMAKHVLQVRAAARKAGKAAPEEEPGGGAGGNTRACGCWQAPSSFRSRGSRRSCRSCCDSTGEEVGQAKGKHATLVATDHNNEYLQDLFRSRGSICRLCVG
jgi:hypothetical protein